jgi:hypothetical protein
MASDISFDIEVNPLNQTANFMPKNSIRRLKAALFDDRRKNII